MRDRSPNERAVRVQRITRLASVAWVALAAALSSCSPPPSADANSTDGSFDAIGDRPLTDVLLGDNGTCVDMDNDGHPSAACGGDDCDDDNPRRNPSAREVCDNLGADEDCNPCTVAQVQPSGRGGDGDIDEDGFASDACFNRLAPGAARPVCAPASFDGGASVDRVRVSDTEVRGTDCSDNAMTGAGRFPGATEQCNGLDDNCDGATDEGVSVQCFPDTDGDGFAPAMSVQSRACPSSDPGRIMNFGACPPGTTNRAPTAGAADCADGMGGNSRYPGAMERCNGVDDDCDDTIDEDNPEGGASCTLMSMGSDPGVCRTEARIRCTSGALRCDQAVRPGERQEMCNAIDDDCDGSSDENVCVDSTVDALGRQSAPTGYGTCAGGTVCQVATCADFRGSCDGNPSNGCEVDLRTSGAHCGECGMVCRLGSSCAGALCDRPEVVSIASGPGTQTTCAVLSNGRVACWGPNDTWLMDMSNLPSATASLIAGITDAVEVAVGGIHACARRSTGAVVCWGSNASGRLGNGVPGPSVAPVAVSGLTDAVEIDAGRNHTCARRSTGAVVCWGNNANGQLGDGSMMDRAVPAAVSGLSDATDIELGALHSCAIRATGVAVCWGNNGSGQLGDNTMTSRAAPVEARSIGSVRSLAAGANHTCARVGGDAIYCWGNSSVGQHGNGSTTDRLVPTSTGRSAPSITAGLDFMCEIRAGGVVACWGANSSLQLGVTTTGAFSASAIVAPSVVNAQQLALGSSHACLRSAAGHVACWGNANALGAGAGANSLVPLGVIGTNEVVAVATGATHTCARRGNGQLLCWGANNAGQLGDATTVQRTTPVLSAGALRAVEVSAGDSFTCATDASGAVHCWGSNTVGQLGDGTTTSRGAPAMIAGLANVTQLSSAGDHTCARRSAGDVLCWGGNNAGQLGDGTTMNRSAPTAVAGLTGVAEVSVGVGHACARTARGQVYCWGRNADGQLGDRTTVDRLTPVLVTGVDTAVGVAVGARHTCVRTLTRQVLCWGANDQGQLGNGMRPTASLVPSAVTTLTNVVELASGNNTTCARLSNNEVACWGDNNGTQAGNGTPNPIADASGRVVQPATPANITARSLAMSAEHSCARTLSGTVRCWGAASNGQLGTGFTNTSRFSVAVVGLTD
ncbi:MAG: hypothetical protein JNK05_12400 [Myxococcales bacterium]|nr:hypothetical protein [Myxococcales bacterium]